MTDATDKIVGLVPLVIGAKIVEKVIDDMPRKKQLVYQCRKRRRW